MKRPRLFKVPFPFLDIWRNSSCERLVTMKWVGEKQWKKFQRACSADALRSKTDFRNIIISFIFPRGNIHCRLRMNQFDCFISLLLFQCHKIKDDNTKNKSNVKIMYFMTDRTTLQLPFEIVVGACDMCPLKLSGRHSALWDACNNRDTACWIFMSAARACVPRRERSAVDSGSGSRPAVVTNGYV